MNNKKKDMQAFDVAMERLPSVLARLGIPDLRKGQDEAVYTLLALKDCYTVLPTSHGKSLIFTVPTLVFNWRTIIFTPLVALMQDHLHNLRKKGLTAAQISSSQTPKENEIAIDSYVNGEVNFLLIAPERLQNANFKAIMEKHPPDMIAVDEAHCLSQWAMGFRSSYCRIADFIKAHEPKVVLTLTATSPIEVETDIINILGLDPNIKKVIYLPPRLNLKLHSLPYPGDSGLIHLTNSMSGSGIIYCSTVKNTEQLFDNYSNHIKGGCLVYNGQLSRNDKFANQNSWTSGDVRVAVCTNAFGLGINKPDTRFVIYKDLPGSIEELSQGFGRAGRDGKDAFCMLYVSDDSYSTQKFFIDCGFPSKVDIRNIYQQMKLHADRNGVCNETLTRMADKAGVNKWTLQALSHNLQAFRVIERLSAEKTVQIKIKSDPDHQRYLKYYSLFEDYGYINDKGFLELELSFLAEQAGSAEQTVITHLRYMDSQDYIKLILPDRRPPIRIIGDINNVDFDYLENKRSESYKKLEQVLEFHRTPNKNKHDYLQQYFNQQYKR